MPAMARRIAPRAGPSCAAEATRLGARVERDVRVVGIDVDAQTRCAHYHSPLDVVALKFKCCGVWHPCIDCHRALADHAPLPWPMAERSAEAVLCGMCGSRMSIAAYLDCANACPHCGAAFNPGCAAHHHLYFEMQEPSAGGARGGHPLASKEPSAGGARGGHPLAGESLSRGREGIPLAKSDG